MDDESPMTPALVSVTASKVPLRLVAVRRHAALVRALLEELEPLAPSAGAKADEEVIGEQLIEELTLLCRRLQECTTAMTRTFGLGTVPMPVMPSNGGGRW
jgi:hypothetical protein